MYSQEQVHTKGAQLNCTSTKGQFSGIHPTGNYTYTTTNLRFFSTCLQTPQQGKKLKYLIKYYFN